MNRLPKDEYYLNIAKEVSIRSTCMMSRIGAIIVKDDQIVATGYNGAPRSTKDCYGHNLCMRRKLNIPSGQRYELCRSVHAEQNAIINAARAGVSLLNGDMFIYGIKQSTGETINVFPCFICKKMIINAGIVRLIAKQSDGSIKIFYIKDWVKEWQQNDIIDDKERYFVDYNK